MTYHPSDYTTDALPMDETDQMIIRMVRRGISYHSICMALDITEKLLDQRVDELEKIYDL